MNRFRDHVKNVEKEAGVSNLIESSAERDLAHGERALAHGERALAHGERALARGDRAEKERQRKSKLSNPPR